MSSGTGEQACLDTLSCSPSTTATAPTSRWWRPCSRSWEIDSHTVHHLDPTTLSPSQLRYELVVSRRDLRRLFGVPVNFFCYPAGAYDPAVVAATKAAGYLAATTTNPGLASPSQLFALVRIRVAGGESLGEFAAGLRDATAGPAPASSRAGGQ
jgi:peptidoglycan/xylan/chitin deacetylase (PgdA/CDA1 family)